MNRVWIALALGLFGVTSQGCKPSTVGDPCTPEQEFSPRSAGAQPETLTLDLNSVQCDTRVCMSHYFRGRVSCPYGNGPSDSAHTVPSPNTCFAVKGLRGLYSVTGDYPTTPAQSCCPIIGRAPDDNEDIAAGDPQQGNGITAHVDPQCANRTAQDAVYCTCRCDVPDKDKDGLPVDRSKLNLCTCPDGFACTPICDSTHGGCSALPFGKWGSYCVKQSQVEVDISTARSKCGTDLPIPPQP